MEQAELREAVHDALCTIAAIWDTNSPPGCKVFREWTAPADTELPFIEYAFIGDIRGVNKCAIHKQVEVLCYGNPDSTLDDLADLVVATLHHQWIPTPSGGEIRLCYMKDSQMDIWHEDLKKHGVRLLFWLPAAFWT